MKGGRCELVSRNGNTLKSFPALCAQIGGAISGDAVLDGEIVSLGPDGRPLFMDLMRRRGDQHFYAFDILWFNGCDLRGLPLLKRKAMLKKVVRPPALYVDHITGTGVGFFRAACTHDLEGIVAKLASGTYDPDATTWVKIRNSGYSQMEA